MIRQFDPKTDFTMTGRQIRDFDDWATKSAGIPGAVLMENAGRSCAEIIIEQLNKSAGRKVCIFCGTGNNGGDGFVIARHLINAGFQAVIAVLGNITKIKGDAEINYKIASNMTIPLNKFDPSSGQIEEDIEKITGGCDLLVDAIFGTGLKGTLTGGFDLIVKKINSLGKPVVAVDIPSGLDCDTGKPLGDAVKASITVTFAAAKKGFINPLAAEYTGRIYIASIGIEPEK
jgi:NAD(P)H-hydrate epimerase